MVPTPTGRIALHAESKLELQLLIREEKTFQQQLISTLFQFNLAMMMHFLCGIKKSSRNGFTKNFFSCSDRPGAGIFHYFQIQMMFVYWILIQSRSEVKTKDVVEPHLHRTKCFAGLSLSRDFSLITMLFINDIALR